MNKRTSRVIGLVAAVAVGLMLGAAGAALAAAGDPIKQSRSGICWCPGASHYDQTTNFTAFASINSCLAADGRHPKRGQGDCPTDAEAGLLELRASVEALSLRVAALEADAFAALAEEQKPARSAFETYNFCSGELGRDEGLWASSIAKWCQGIPPGSVDDYVLCFTTQRGNGAWGSTADERCRAVLGIQ